MGFLDSAKAKMEQLQREAQQLAEDIQKKVNLGDDKQSQASTSGTPTPATTADPTPAPSVVGAPSSTPAEKKKNLSLAARKSIQSKYDADIGVVLARAQKLLAAPTLKFVPNFETNYATLKAFDATLDREEYDDNNKLRRDWDSTIGPATLNYFDGFKSQLEWQKFNKDELMQEGFKDAVPTLTVSFLVSPDVTRTYNDAVIENGVFVIRTKPQYWWSNPDSAAEQLTELL